MTQTQKELILITGVYPPKRCAVADSLYKMFQTNEAKNWQLYYSQDWSLKSIPSKIKEIKSSSAQIINLQYPTAGYGLTLVPHFLCIYFSLFSKKVFSVTVHEYSQLGWKAKLASIIFLFFANKLIFTNEFELNFAKRINPFLCKKSTIIKIYSNIKEANIIPPIENRTYDLAYFGFIRENKGLEDFIDVVLNLKQDNPNLNVYVMGQTQPQYINYYQPILNRMENIGIDLFLNKEESDVASILANTKIAYLPFPDGVSERRGSFLAVIQNRCIVVTTKGPFTVKAHEDICFFTSKKNAKEIITTLLKMESAFYKERQLLITNFIKNEIPQSWEELVKNYKRFLC